MRLVAAQRPLRILEIGCGHGGALLDLADRYSDQVELHGINRDESDGTHVQMEQLAAARGINCALLLDGIRIHYFDVCEPWPFPSDHFDVIYSQSAFIWFCDKVFALHEVHRVLHEDGVARIELRVVRHRHPAEYAKTLTIYDGDHEVAFAEYIRPFGNLRLETTGDSVGRKVVRVARQGLRLVTGRRRKPHRRQPFLVMTKGHPFNLGLSLAKSIIPPKPWGGAQSIYRVNGEQQLPQAGPAHGTAGGVLGEPQKA
jgi:SAM-dependent methyltransferase